MRRGYGVCFFRIPVIGTVPWVFTSTIYKVVIKGMVLFIKGKLAIKGLVYPPGGLSNHISSKHAVLTREA